MHATLVPHLKRLNPSSVNSKLLKFTDVIETKIGDKQIRKLNKQRQDKDIPHAIKRCYTSLHSDAEGRLLELSTIL